MVVDGQRFVAGDLDVLLRVGGRSSSSYVVVRRWVVAVHDRCLLAVPTGRGGGSGRRLGGTVSVARDGQEPIRRVGVGRRGQRVRVLFTSVETSAVQAVTQLNAKLGVIPE